MPSDPPPVTDPAELARRLLDLWQDYLANLAQDPQWVGTWQRLLAQASPAPTASSPEAAASQLAPWGAMMAQLFAGLAPAASAPGPDGHKPATASALSPSAGPAPAAAAPAAGRGGAGELEARLAALEAKLAELQRQPARAIAKPRPAARRPRSGAAGRRPGGRGGKPRKPVS